MICHAYCADLVSIKQLLGHQLVIYVLQEHIRQVQVVFSALFVTLVAIKVDLA
jgi:hypothetical protein